MQQSGVIAENCSIENTPLRKRTKTCKNILNEKINDFVMIDFLKILCMQLMVFTNSHNYSLCCSTV